MSRPRRSRHSPAGRHGGKWLRPQTRWAIYARDGFACVYCLAHVLEALTIDHLRSVERGGTNAPSNLVTCCRGCNSAKQGRTLRAWYARLRAAGVDVAAVRARVARTTRRRLNRSWGRYLACLNMENRMNYAKPAIRALTLWRPYDHAILHGPKPVENRGWPPPAFMLGRDLVLHAGKKFDTEAWNFPEGYVIPDEADCPTGIVGAVSLVGWVKRDGASLSWAGMNESQAEHWASSAWYAPGSYGWLVSDPRPLEQPIPCAGKQGLWLLTSSLERQVEAQIGRLAHRPPLD